MDKQITFLKTEEGFLSNEFGKLEFSKIIEMLVRRQTFSNELPESAPHENCPEDV